MGRVLFAIGLSLLTSSKGQAVNTTVHDPWNYMIHSEALSKSVALLEQATSLNQHISKLNRLMGVDFMGNFTDVSSLVRGLERPLEGFGLSFLEGQVRQAFPQTSQVTFIQSKDFWKGTLLPQANERLTPQKQEQYLSQRAHILKEASLNALALSTQQKQKIMDDRRKLEALATKASSTTNLLEAQQLTNHLMVVLIGEISSLRALIAQQLELQGSREMQKASLVFGK